MYPKRRALGAVTAALVLAAAVLVACTGARAGTPGPGGASGEPVSPSVRVLAASRRASLPLAPIWKTAVAALPARPASCPPLTPNGTGAASQRPSVRAPVRQQASLTGDPLWPPPAAGADPDDYPAFDRTPVTSPPTTPSNWANSDNSWKLSSQRSAVAAVSSNPQELCGVEGSSADLAWQTTTGRPTTVIAVLDSGIDWCNPGIVEKIYLSRTALPLPENSAGLTKLQLIARGDQFLDPDPYDLIDSGVFDVAQYAGDPRVAAVAKAYGGLFCATHDDAGYSGISPEDLIRTFADATYPSGAANPYVVHHIWPAGYLDAIAGWSVLDNNDDPYDDVQYDHGTGEAQDMAGAADGLNNEVGACPNCMILPVRVGTSFISSGNEFAEGVLFAVDSGATIVSEALGTLDETETAAQAISYAESRGVPIVGSAADEESEHQNLPSAMGHIIDVNSTTSETSWDPPSYLYLNGCTDYGAQISVTVPSTSCSSEATGKTAGTVGLLESAAADAVAAGKLSDYPGLRNAEGQPVPLSANEVMQLVTMSADDVNFATAAPNARPPAPAHNYKVTAPNVPLATTTMYPTTPGYDEYTGWGRLNADRIVQWVAEGRIPPEAEIDAPLQFETFATTGTLQVTGMVGAVRSSSYRYQVDVGIGASPADGTWHVASEGSGEGSFHGVLARIPLAAVAALFPGGASSLSGGAVSATGSPDPDRFTFMIRVEVEDAGGLVGMAQSPDFLHDDAALVLSRQLDSSIVAPPRLAPLGPKGEDVLLVTEAGGTIDALLPDGRELPGWPVHTDYMPAHLGEAAYTSGAITARAREELIGGVAVGDLADASGTALDVVATGLLGGVYAWNAAGHLLPGWPVHSDPAFSEPAARNAQNRLLPGFAAAPALGDLTGNGQLDVVAASLDRHVYAWSPSGRAVPGWPVLVVDPAEVQSVNPVTNQVTFLPTSNVLIGTELVDTPAIGSLSGKGLPQVIVGSDEEYGGVPYANLGALGSILDLAGVTTANSRVYAIWANGSKHPAKPGSPAPPGMPDPGAFLTGWPAQIAQVEAGILPTIGDGVTGSPALGDLSGNGKLEVVTSSTVGPVYVLSPNGSSFLGYGSDGLPNVGGFQHSGGSGSILDWTLPGLGSPVVAPIGPANAPASVIDPGASLGRLLDEEAAGDQTPHVDQIDAWSATTGALHPGFPDQMNDLQFFDQPLVADVAGSSAGGYVVEGSGLYDLRAYGPTGEEAPSFPKFTGGWMTYGPAYGPLDARHSGAGRRDAFGAAARMVDTDTSVCVERAVAGGPSRPVEHGQPLRDRRHRRQLRRRLAWPYATSDLTAQIVPGSGTGELAGISGGGRIEIDADGAHTFFLDYELG